MFVVVYHYDVPVAKTKRYIQFEKQSMQIYLENGCQSVEIYRDAKNPKRWMEVNKFKDQKHYEEVVAAAAADPRLSQLTQEFKSLFKANEYPEKRAYFQML